MKDLFTAARHAAVNAFIADCPANNPNQSYITFRQRHDDDCITACLRFLSDTYDQEAPSSGLTFSEALLIASNFGLYLSPILDLATVRPLCCLLLGLTTDPRNHALLIHMESGSPVALYDPAKGVVFKGNLIPAYEWAHLALIYKPSPLRVD